MHTSTASTNSDQGPDLRSAGPLGSGRLSSLRGVGVVAVGLASVALLLGSFFGRSQELVAGLAAGVGLASLCWWTWVVRPLASAARVAQQIESGDLSRTVAEVGPRPLRHLARVINGITADFQEVLLLFAHLVRSADRAVAVLRLHVDHDASPAVDRRHLSEVLGSIREMEAMVRDFKYFRIRLENGTITDSGFQDGCARVGPSAVDDGRGSETEAAI